MAELIGRTLDGYDIVEKIGAGAVGTIYRAYRPTLKRHVAVKVLHEELAHDEELVRRFQRGALTAAGLKHPNVIPIYRVGQEGDLCFVAMEYVAGPSLAQRLKEEGALSPEATLAILRPVAAALDYVHGEGALHRNLKPSNILLMPEGPAVVSDFVAARERPAGADPMATPAYASPEQADEGMLDARSDLYALGVILYEMLTGQVPFPGDVPVASRGEAPTPPSHLRPDLPAPVDRVVLRALEEQKARRYQSAGELVQALAQASGLPAEEPAADLIYPLGRGWPLRGVLAGVAVVVVVAFLLVRALARPARPRPTPTVWPTQVALVATATPTSSPTASPTATTPAPTSVPTATTLPTVTEVPTTAAPVRTHLPTATPTLASAPLLLEPANGSGHSGSGVTFRWRWERPLAPGEHFDLRVWREGEPHYGIAWVEQSFYVTTVLSPGRYHWSVAVIRGTGLRSDGVQGWEPVSHEAETWWFSYSPGSTKPGKPAEPTPRP